MNPIIPFNKPWLVGKETEYITDAAKRGQLAGDGHYTKKCHELIQILSGSKSALLTHSCTASLEMTALLADIQPGDEIIMPSYTFVSTANAFALRGGVPVFLDIRKDTLNIDENLIAEAITDRTRAVVPVHYAGVACEMDVICDVARRNSLLVIEDAAQAMLASYKGKPLGSIGDLGAYSFHETKNVISGEGGALLINGDDYKLQAEMIREKGTDRSRFFRGQVDKYTWQTIGSSYLPGEIISAFLLAQLESAQEITKKRKEIWDFYYEAIEPLESQGLLRRPIIPPNCAHNAHMFYILLNKKIDRRGVLEHMKQLGVHGVFHYIPLHSAPAGQKYARAVGSMENTSQLSEQIVRLPLWVGMSQAEQSRVIDALSSSILIALAQ